MDIKQNISFLMLFLLAKSNATYDQERFIANMTMKDIIVGSDIIGDMFTSRTLLECSISCLRLESCRSLFYTRHVSKCQLHSKIFNSSTFPADTQMSVGTMHYHLKQVGKWHNGYNIIVAFLADYTRIID